MKIENRGIEITDVPGITRITTGPSPYDDGTTGAHIRLMETELYLEAGPLAELIEALQAAHAALTATPAGPGREPKTRVFSAGDSIPIPTGVMAVEDSDGDLWHRNFDGLWTCQYPGPGGERANWTTERLLASGFAPVTRVPR